MSKNMVFYSCLGGVVILGVLALVVLGVRHRREQHARQRAGSAYDAVFVQKQSQTLHPQVVAKLQSLIPEAVITNYEQADASGMPGCAVQLPPDKANLMRKVMESIVAVNREFRKQGYNGFFELYLGERLVKRIPA